MPPGTCKGRALVGVGALARLLPLVILWVDVFVQPLPPLLPLPLLVLPPVCPQRQEGND